MPKRSNNTRYQVRAVIAGILLSLSWMVSPGPVFAQGVQSDTRDCVLDRCSLLERGPLIAARAVPYIIIVLLLLLALHYVKEIILTYRQYRAYRKGIARIIETKRSLNGYLAITTQHLNNPASIMLGGVNLLESLSRVPKQRLNALKKTVLDFRSVAGRLASANQVSASTTVNTNKVFSTKVSSPFKRQNVLVPGIVAILVLFVANVVFIMAGVYNKSVLRITIEFGYIGLSIAVVAILFRYLELTRKNKNMAIRQLAIESRHYQQRADFITLAATETGRYARIIGEQAELMEKTPETRLISNGLGTLRALADGFKSLKLFADFTMVPPLFNVSAYAKRAANGTIAIAAKKEVTLRADIKNGIVSRIHPEEIEQIIGTLLDNAVKFSRPGDKIYLTLRARFGRMIIEVRDEGEGISADRLPGILSPFGASEDSLQYNYEGTGVNLYLCKVIVDKFGGEITIDSRLEQGTKVIVSFPIYHTAESIEAIFVKSEVAYKE